MQRMLKPEHLWHTEQKSRNCTSWRTRLVDQKNHVELTENSVSKFNLAVDVRGIQIPKCFSYFCWTKFSPNGSIWSPSVYMHCALHIHKPCVFWDVRRSVTWGLGGTRQSCNGVLAVFARVTPSLTFAGCEVRPPSQHALERGTMKEAIDFCWHERGSFYVCPVGGWGRSSPLTQPDPWA